MGCCRRPWRRQGQRKSLLELLLGAMLAPPPTLSTAPAQAAKPPGIYDPALRLSRRVRLWKIDHGWNLRLCFHCQPLQASSFSVNTILESFCLLKTQVLRSHQEMKSLG